MCDENILTHDRPGVAGCGDTVCLHAPGMIPMKTRRSIDRSKNWSRCAVETLLWCAMKTDRFKTDMVLPAAGSRGLSTISRHDTHGNIFKVLATIII